MWRYTVKEENEMLAYEQWCEKNDRDYSDDAWEEFQTEMEQAREDHEIEMGERRREERDEF